MSQVIKYSSVKLSSYFYRLLSAPPPPTPAPLSFCLLCVTAWNSSTELTPEQQSVTGSSFTFGKAVIAQFCIMNQNFCYLWHYDSTPGMNCNHGLLQNVRCRRFFERTACRFLVHEKQMGQAAWSHFWLIFKANIGYLANETWNVFEVYKITYICSHLYSGLVDQAAPPRLVLPSSSDCLSLSRWLCFFLSLLLCILLSPSNPAGTLLLTQSSLTDSTLSLSFLPSSLSFLSSSCHCGEVKKKNKKKRLPASVVLS